MLVCRVLARQKRKETEEEEVTPETLERDIKARVSCCPAFSYSDLPSVL